MGDNETPDDEIAIAKQEAAELLKEAKEAEAEESKEAEPTEPEPAPAAEPVAEPPADPPPAEKQAEAAAEEDQEDDPDFLKKDLELTEEDVKQNRKKMMDNLNQYMKRGTMNRDCLVERRFAKPKSEEDMKMAAFNRTKMMAKKRAERAAAAKKQQDMGAMLAEDDEDEDSVSSAASGAPLTAEEKKAKDMEATIKRKERAARRRSRSRSESMEREAALSPTSGGAAAEGEEGGLAMLGEDVEYDDEELLSPTTRSRKPAANPGCVVHSIGGKFVQVPMFGGQASVPTGLQRRRLQEATRAGK